MAGENKEVTLHYSFPLPHVKNPLSFDVEQLRKALVGVDSKLKALELLAISRASIVNPTFRGTVSGITASMVGATTLIEVKTMLEEEGFSLQSESLAFSLVMGA